MERRGDRTKRGRRIKMIKLMDICLRENWYLCWWGCYC
jgi:hypothetical protein